MINSMFSYNLTQGLDMAKQHQEAIRQEIERNQQLSRTLRTLRTQESAERRFHRMYKVRHWLHRVAPRMARTFL